MSKRLTGLNPLAYLGVEPTSPSNTVMATKSPTANDVQNFNIGDFWVNTAAQQLWVLVSQARGVAVWIPLFGGASDVFVTDSGTAVPAGGIIHINGDGLNISTSAPGPSNIVDITLNPNLTLTGLTLSGFTGGVLISNGSGAISEVTTTNHSLLIGNASGTISSLGVATNGQLPIGSTGADPVLSTITAGSGVTVTNGAGSITIAATGSGGTVTSISAGTGITLTPSPITTTGSVALTVPVIVANGGTGRTTLTNHGLLVGAGTAAITQLADATDGQLPIGSTGADPVLATITAGSGISVTNGAGSITIAATGAGTGTVTSISAGTGITLTPDPITTTGSVALTVPVVVANGGTGDTSFTAYSVVCGGTTSTGALQNVSGVGAAGQVLTSNGAGTLPTWQIGNVPQAVTLNLTNAQIKSLQATPIQILAAQGANTIVVPISAVSFLNYGGSNAFVAPSGLGICLYFTNVNTGAPLLAPVSSGSAFTKTTSNYQIISIPQNNSGTPTASCINQPLFVAIDQAASGEITGNAANDNLISIRLEYFVLTVPL